MQLRRRSKKRRALDAVGTYLKFKAISKAAKGARKSLKGYAAYKTTKSVAKRAPKPVKALPVVTSERRLAGIVSMADLFNQDPGALTSVAAVMTSPVTTIREGAPVSDLVALMTDLDLRHVPVVDVDDVLVGIVTRAELIATMHRALVGPARAGG